MNLIAYLLEAIRDAITGKVQFPTTHLDAMWHMMKAEEAVLRDCHVIWLSHLDPDTVVDSDATNYKGPGWYHIDEADMITSGPYNSFIKATFESGRYHASLVPEDHAKKVVEMLGKVTLSVADPSVGPKT